MKGYLSIDEAISITESKIKGSIFEILGTERFLQRALDSAEIEPVFYFSGYAVLQAYVKNEFYNKNENIKNMWRVSGYFRDKHSNWFIFPTVPKEKLKSPFRNLDNDRFILSSNSGQIIKLDSARYIGSHTKEALNKTNDKGEITLLNCGADLFNKEPVYEGTFGHEELQDTLIIDRSKVYIDISELSRALELEPSAYILTPSHSLTNGSAQQNPDNHSAPKSTNQADIVDSLKATIKKLEEENQKLQLELEQSLKTVKSQDYLDCDSKFFSIEMKLCHDTWNYLYLNGNSSSLPHGQQAVKYLKNHPDFDVNKKAIERITTVTNPKAILAKTTTNQDI